MEINDVHRVRIVNVRPKLGHNSSWESGNISLKDDVLSQLPRYFEQIDLLRRVDPDMYAMQAKLGASITSRSSMIAMIDPETAAHYMSADQIPSFGCSYIHDGRTNAEIEADKFLRPSFVSWTKLNKPLYPKVAAVAGQDVYHVVVIHHDSAKRRPTPMQWHMAVPTIASMAPLKELGRGNVVMRKRGQIGRAHV